MITTTLNRIQASGLYISGWQKLLAHLGKTEADDEPLPYATILHSNGLVDAIGCCRAEPQHAREWRLFAVWRARQMQHLMADPRSVAALDVAERFANGKASNQELDAAWVTAWDAVWAAEAAAQDADWDAWDAAAWDAWDDAQAAAHAAAWNAQSAKFLELVGEAK